jgi:hypothetical protein
MKFLENNDNNRQEHRLYELGLGKAEGKSAEI